MYNLTISRGLTFVSEEIYDLTQDKMVSYFSSSLAQMVYWEFLYNQKVLVLMTSHSPKSPFPPHRLPFPPFPLVWVYIVQFQGTYYYLNVPFYCSFLPSSPSSFFLTNIYFLLMDLFLLFTSSTSFHSLVPTHSLPIQLEIKVNNHGRFIFF